MNTVDVLKAARERIEKGWCQGATAVDADGELASVSASPPVAWCVIGAVYEGADDTTMFAESLRVLERYIDGTLASWNDAEGRTQFDVLNLFDKAIEEASCE